MAESFRIPWVNDGEPFEVSGDHLPMGAIDDAQEARMHALREGLDDLSDVPEFAEDLYRSELANAMGHAENRILIYRYLCSVDETLEEESSHDVMDRLSASTVGALGDAMDDARDEADTGEDSVIEDPSG